MVWKKVRKKISAIWWTIRKIDCGGKNGQNYPFLPLLLSLYASPNYNLAPLPIASRPVPFFTF